MGRVVHIGNESSVKAYIGIFDNFDALLLALPTANNGDLAFVKNSQGFKWFPGSFGGTFYSKGSYVWTGSQWDSSVDEIAQELELLRPTVETRDPNATDDDTTLYQVGSSWINTLTEGLFISKVISTGASIWHRVQVMLLNEVTINTEDDFIQSGGKIILGNKIYKINTELTTFTMPFDVSGITTSCFLKINGVTIYSGSGALFQGTLTGTLEVTDGGIINTSSQSVYDVVGTGTFTNLLIIRRSGFVAFASMGKIENVGGGLIFGRVQHLNTSVGGLIIKNCNAVNIDIDINNTVSNNCNQLVLDDVFGDVSITSGGLIGNSGENFLQISPDIIVSKVIINDIPYSKSDGSNFLAPAKTGTVTDVVDNGSGKARMTITAHSITIEQKGILSGFITETSYNGTFQILSVVDANTLDIDVIFTATDTGAFTTGDSNDFRFDTRFEFDNNGDSQDSSEEFIFTLLNPLTITIPSAGTIVNVTGLSTDWSAEQMRRFGFQLDANGTARYIHTKDRSFPMSANMTMGVSTGGAKLMSAYITKNGSPIGTSMFEQDSARQVGFHPAATVDLTTGDYIGVAVENVDDAVDLNVISTTVSG